MNGRGKGCLTFYPLKKIHSKTFGRKFNKEKIKGFFIISFVVRFLITNSKGVRHIQENMKNHTHTRVNACIHINSRKEWAMKGGERELERRVTKLERGNSSAWRQWLKLLKTLLMKIYKALSSITIEAIHHNHRVDLVL